MVNEIGYLNLWRNNFSGIIPAWIGSLSLLDWLTLDENDFSGELPIEICDLVNLEILGLSDKLIEGIFLF
jgi:Leucine-rich repeat (LRR) protein